MNRIAIAVLAGALLGVPCAQAKLPPAPAPNPAEQAAKAAKAKATAAKTAADLEAAEDRAAANYRRNKGAARESAPAPAKPGGK